MINVNFNEATDLVVVTCESDTEKLLVRSFVKGCESAVQSLDQIAKVTDWTLKGLKRGDNLDPDDTGVSLWNDRLGRALAKRQEAAGILAGLNLISREDLVLLSGLATSTTLIQVTVK